MTDGDFRLYFFQYDTKIPSSLSLTSNICVHIED